MKCVRIWSDNRLCHWRCTSIEIFFVISFKARLNVFISRDVWSMTLYWITGCLIPDLHINQLTHLVSVNEQLDEIFMKIETSYQSFDLTSGNPVSFHGSRRMLWKLTSDQRPSAGGKKGPPVGAVGAWDFDAPQGRQNINQKPRTRHLSTFPDFPPTNPIVTVPSLMRCGAGFGPTPNPHTTKSFN